MRSSSFLSLVVITKNPGHSVMWMLLLFFHIAGCTSS